MANISSVVLPDGTSYDLKDKNALPEDGTAVAAYRLEAQYSSGAVAAGWYKFLTLTILAGQSRNMVLLISDSYTAPVGILAIRFNRASSGAGQYTVRWLATTIAIDDVRYIYDSTAGTLTLYFYKRTNTNGRVNFRVLLSTTRTGTSADLTGSWSFTAVEEPTTAEVASAGINNNAATATNALNDGDGNPISTTYVPATRTVNGKALSANIDLDAADVGAAPAAAGVYYGTSDTAAAAQAKTATVSGVTELYDGLRICVWFAHAQNYNGQPTLNVNSLGAKPVNRTPTVAAVRYEWGPGVVDFVYSEANDIWVIVKGTHGGSERYGVVLLSNAVNSSSDTGEGTAATPSAVKAAYDAAISAQDMAAKALGDPAGINVAVGEYVSYNGGLYTVNTAITSDMVASVFESYLDAVPDGGMNALNNQTLDGVYSCYGYRANLISTVDVQLKKDYVTDGTTYRIFAPLYLIDFNSPQTVDEYYLMLDQNNPNRFVRVTSNNSTREITAMSFDPSTGVLTLTLNGTRRYVGVDVRIAKQLI